MDAESLLPCFMETVYQLEMGFMSIDISFISHFCKKKRKERRGGILD